MLINDKVDAVFIPDSPSRIKATDYNQIKNEIQECITEAGLTPTKDVIQLPQALKILTAQSGAEEVAKIEAAGQEQLDAINTAGAQAVQDAQDAADTATSKATEAASSASAAASSASEASGSASTAATQATNASASAELAQKWATQTTAEVVSGQGYGAKYYADQAADSASSANTSASTATTKATEASASASQASQSAIDAANSAASARGLQIGAVYFSQSSLATDNPGALPLWTGEYYSNGSSLYPDFYTWVKSHTELCKTKTEYDTAISTYGECPFYVVDEVAGSLRLPKLVNYLKMANATDGVTQAQAGLPNITGTEQNGGSYQVGAGGQTGAFSATRANCSTFARTGSGSHVVKIDFDASRCSAVYGRSSTVTPAHTTLYPWVYAFNSAVSASEAQAAEFTGALSGKADTDLGNLSTAGKNLASGLGMPSNVSEQLKFGASGTQYTAPANGYFVFYRESDGSNTSLTLLNVTTQLRSEICGTIGILSIFVPASKGDKVNMYWLNGASQNSIYFVYAEGSKSEAN